jgi:hypothetical protein
MTEAIAMDQQLEVRPGDEPRATPRDAGEDTTLSEYLRRFDGRDPVHVALEAPGGSAEEGFATLKRALGLDEEIALGDRVVLTPGCLNPIKGVVDISTEGSLGVRTHDALYRFHDRGTIAVTHHLFAEDAHQPASERAWRAWLRGVFATSSVACLNREAVA